VTDELKYRIPRDVRRELWWETVAPVATDLPKREVFETREQTMDEVFPGLWIGNLTDARKARDFDLTVNVSGVVTPDAAHGHMHVDWPLNDTWVTPDPDKLWGLARLIASVVKNDPEARVFVHCAMGWNRSGIVVACALMLIAGVNGDDAVAMLRRARGENALCNQHFENYVRKHSARTNKASAAHRTGREKRNGGGKGWKGVWR
jgi:protein-tyrosine phosphatase